MKKLFNLVITCKHNDPNKVFKTQDGEYVCGCGVVLQERLVEDAIPTTPSTSQRHVSLYHQLENGGDPKDMKVTNKKIHIQVSATSEFSNLCDKLQMPNFVQQRAWKIYHLLRTNTYYTRAKCAAFSIYIACRESGQAIDESQIREIIGIVLCVKNVPGMLNVISEIHEDALKLGIDTNDGHSSLYYLNLVISAKQHLFADSLDYDRFKIRVMGNFQQLSGNHKNKAKRAVDIALCEMGVK